jgi:hypothetical protein
MADSDRSDTPAPPAEQNSSSVHGKKPYTKPDYRVERVFETTALACGKIDVTQAQCRTNRKVS